MNHQQFGDLSKETVDAANALLLLSGRHTQWLAHVEAAETLFLLSGQTPVVEPPAEEVKLHKTKEEEAAETLLFLSVQTPVNEPPAKKAKLLKTKEEEEAAATLLTPVNELPAIEVKLEKTTTVDELPVESEVKLEKTTAVNDLPVESEVKLEKRTAKKQRRIITLKTSTFARQRKIVTLKKTTSKKQRQNVNPEEPLAERDFEMSRISFEEFRQRALADRRTASGGKLVKSNPKMQRQIRGSKAPDKEESTDFENYLTSREKNNTSAKNSRDRKMLAEIENTIKKNYYDGENAAYAEELARMRNIINTINERLKKKSTTAAAASR